MYKRILTIFSVCSIISSCSNKTEQWNVSDNKNTEVIREKFFLLHQKVLNEQNSKKEYIFGDWNKNKFEHHFKYLGKIKTKENEKIKIISIVFYEGELTKKGISRIFVIDSLGPIGSYYIPNINDLPQKMENGKLVFENQNNGCDKIETKIDFTSGIPSKIFRKCRGNQGDLYEFQIEE